MRQHEDTGPPPARPNGSQAIVGAIIAIVGVLAAVNPTNVVLRALNEAAPQLATAIPTVISSCGAIIAALSQPPRFRGESEGGSK